ncbi:unannotated protein [freshwater metagenome]|uniref:Unannotated protein n=1 Tax=freshwater metagenome TaxID=449393 RepID=A0A6J7CN10_9ZZZZ
MNGLVKEIDTDKRKIGWGIIWLLDEAANVAIGANISNAKLAWVINVGQENLCCWGIGTAGSACLSEVGDKICEVLLEHVVAEVHHEVVVA